MHTLWDELRQPRGPGRGRRLAGAAALCADGCVWGSGCPIIRQLSRVDYGPLLKLAERLMPDARQRRAVMWDTPRRLFGFA